MESAGAGAAPRSPLWILPAVLLIGAWLAWGFVDRPFHADEAGQWALASEGAAHSKTGDRFHGPALGLVARGLSALGAFDLAEAGPAALRSIPSAFALSLLLIPWVLPSRAVRGGLAAAFALLAVPAATRFIQEPLMVAALTWAAALWLRSGASGETRFRLLAGLCAGFALACKITAAMHLGLAAAALLLFRQSCPGWRGFVAFAAGTLGSWALWQSSFLTDLPALGTWWTQFFRAFGVASGVSEPALPMGSPLPWWFTGGLLALALLLRSLPLRSGQVGPAKSHDFLLLAVGLAYAVHLALPYKTPWLLMTPDAVLLVFILPGLLARLPGIAGAACVIVLGLLSHPGRFDYVETKADVPALAAALAGDPAARPSLVLVQGDHVWPFPFYLRGLHVAYGAVPDAAQADVWLLQAHGTEPPRAEGRRVVPFLVRENELWWALAREPHAARIEASLRPPR
jgi:hypothetical protein